MKGRYGRPYKLYRYSSVACREPRACHHGCSTGSEVGGASPYVMALKEALMSLRVEGDFLFGHNLLCNRHR